MMVVPIYLGRTTGFANFPATPQSTDLTVGDLGDRPEAAGRDVNSSFQIADAHVQRSDLVILALTLARWDAARVRAGGVMD